MQGDTAGSSGCQTLVSLLARWCEMRACLQKLVGAELVVVELFPQVEEARLEILVRLALISDELLL